MWKTSLLLLSQGLLLVSAQSLTGCHNHGNVEYCFGPDGEETAITSGNSAQATSVPATTTSAEITEVTGCHMHDTETVCKGPNGSEIPVSGSVTQDPPPAEFTGCHSHGSDTFCMDPDGEEVQLVLGEGEGESSSHDEQEGADGEENCHFHAGVEHCVGAGESEGSSPKQCDRKDREYNIPLRIGSLFAILVTSTIGVGGPVVFARLFSKSINGYVFTGIKQFGAGIMLATAFVHLFTHAHLMFNNECLGELKYEGTTAAIAMAGIFLTFLLEYLGNRVILLKRGNTEPEATSSDHGSATTKDNENAPPHQPTLGNLGHHHHHVEDVLSVAVMEAGIIFHSVIIGLTLIVAGDSGYISLFIVIIFHQMFEGLALGSRIAELADTNLLTKFMMCLAFALITPIGMAIGLGVLHTFNGNDPSTIIAIGTLDALSAGILSWAAIVDMMTHDWLYGDLKNAPALRSFVGMIALVSGMILMSVLGKWA